MTSKQLKYKSSTLDQKFARSYMFLYYFLLAEHFFNYKTFISLVFLVIRPKLASLSYSKPFDGEFARLLST